MVLDKRARLGYRAFLAFYHLHSIKIFAESGMKNSAYIENTDIRFAQSILDSQDRNYNRAVKEHPELVERYEKQFQNRHWGHDNIRGRKEFEN